MKPLRDSRDMVEWGYMELTKQVCSLELAKRLKELGAKQESIWFHCGYSNNTAPEPERWYFSWSIRLSDRATIDNARTQIYSAFTVAELGEILPKKLGSFNIQICRSFTDGWFVGYGDHMNGAGYYVEDGATEADALAKMLVYLLENNLIPKEGVDGRGHQA